MNSETGCCVVGGGPAGVMLAYLLARQGIAVTLLEAHQDFDRDFRGDTLHPSTLEILDALGLADELLKLPHGELHEMVAQTAHGLVMIADLGGLRTKYPFVAMMPQARFLAFLTTAARAFPSFQLVMGARVEELSEAGGVVQGVRYRAKDGLHELRAPLTVGADGRFSRLRKLSGLGEAAIKASPPMDVLWFRLPRKAGDPHIFMGRFGAGHLLVELDRGDEWQIGFLIPKDTYAQLHAAGIAALRGAIVQTAPELADRVGLLADWKDVQLLSVEADRLQCWHKPGLLLIGDAAHVMSPVGGNGINYAIQDAVAAANLLGAPLQAGTLTDDDLARVQRRRERPTRIIQAIVNVIQDRFIRNALDPSKPFVAPGVVRWPGVGQVIARVFAYGIAPEHVQR